MARSRDYRTILIKSLKKPEEAKVYFKAILEECKDCDEEEAQKLFNLAIEDITAAQGSKKCEDILKESLKYLFKIHKEKNGYSAQCIVFPGCVTQADTMKELRKNMKEALSLILEETEKV